MGKKIDVLKRKKICFGKKFMGKKTICDMMLVYKRKRKIVTHRTFFCSFFVQEWGVGTSNITPLPHNIYIFPPHLTLTLRGSPVPDLAFLIHFLHPKEKKIRVKIIAYLWVGGGRGMIVGYHAQSITTNLFYTLLFLKKYFK